MKHGDLIYYRRYVRYRYYEHEEREVFWRKLGHPYRYRLDPVPHVHKYSNGHYYRRARTTSERKQWYVSVEQGVTPRRRRSPRLLPDSWDDRLISTHGNHSWKRQKKRKQWM
jgi:hypothetical protein